VTTDLDQGPIITQRAFNVPPDAEAEDLQRLGQPLEAQALLEAIDLHLNDDVAIHRGRTQLRDPEESDAQLGAPTELNDMIPDRPIDGLGEFVAEQDEAVEADD
jgi:formyltetrahydrofolate deformylase